MTIYRIHLCFEPWDRMELLGKQLPVPMAMGYGHVYCLLDKDGDITKRDFIGLGEDCLEGEIPHAKGLIGLFNRLMRKAKMQLEVEQGIIFLADENDPVASFEISETAYCNAMDYFKNLDGQLVTYDRSVNNCVHYAHNDLKAAGIDLGHTLGLTAGAFFQRALKRSQGNLLAQPLGIQVIERTIPKIKSP